MPKISVNMDVPKAMIDAATKKEVAELTKKLRSAELKLVTRDNRIRSLEGTIRDWKIIQSDDEYKAIIAKAHELTGLLNAKLGVASRDEY